MIFKLSLTSAQNTLIKLFAAFLVLIMSYILLPFYTGGDQVQYRKVYAALPDLSILEGYVFYFSQLHSLEFVHFFLSWITSKFIEKDIFIAVANAILAYVGMAVFQKWKASIFISFFLILTNFYFIVLYLSAERLKFGFIFLALSLLAIPHIKRMYFFASMALVSHTQVIIVYISIILNAFLKQVYKAYSTGKVSKWFFMSFFLILPLFLVKEQLLIKLNAYSNENGLAELLKVLLFFFLSLWYSKKRIQTISVFIPIIIAVYLVGGDRVNLFAYFAFLHYGFESNGGWNVGVLTTTCYFSYATFDFITKVVNYGDGFFSG